MTELCKKRVWGPTPNYPKVLEYKRSDNEFIVIAGPCSVENKEQIFSLAGKVKALGATHLRGGVFRAGTYPGDSFGYVDMDLIRSFNQAALENGLKNIIEILDYDWLALEKVLPYADCLQVGARSQQNYTLLRKLGATGKTIFLKRNTGCTLDEWLGSAEHLLAGGDCKPVLIERGSSTHMNHVRHDLSISVIPAVKLMTQIPIIVDAAHGTGRWDLVQPMTLAGIAAGADGFLCEVHENPRKSLSDPEQALYPIEFENLMTKVNRLRSIYPWGNYGIRS